MEWTGDHWTHWWEATAVVHSRHGPQLHEEKYTDGFVNYFKIRADTSTW